jgi:D-arabinose 1-dehydrogenase-like Zn-dependent alcohol dehydrogenase
MVSTMRAERFYADTKTPAVEDIPIPEPGPGEMLVKVAFCGICHSDLSLINGTFPTQLPVVTQGHEASGTIAKLGPGVTGWSEGDRVVLAAGKPCLQCPNCLRGDFSNCLRIRLMAFAYDGAWAEYTVAQAFGLTRIPDNVPLEQAAILADAVSTPFGTQKHVLGHLGYQNVDIETLATLVSMGRLDLSRSISDIVSLEDVRVGIETLERQEGNPIRILVKP